MKQFEFLFFSLWMSPLKCKDWVGRMDQEVGFIQVEATGNVAPGRDAFKKSLTELLFTSERDEEGGGEEMPSLS